MDNLISRDALWHEIEHSKNKPDIYDGSQEVQWIEECIKNAPVAVVRCGECKYGRPVNKLKAPECYFKKESIVCTCENVVGDEPMVYIPTHYCSYGERKG